MMSDKPALYSALVADDHEDDRFLVRRALERSGRFAVVAEAATGVEALDLAARHRPHLALVDLAMPDLDGLATTSGLRRVSPTTTVVVLSNFGESRMRRPALEAGAAAYLEKTSDPSSLIDVLIGLLEGPRDPESLLSHGEDGEQTTRVILTADETAPTQARRVTRAAVADWGLDAIGDEVQLLVSELVTNSVVHARSDLEVCLRMVGPVLRVEVHDRSASAISALAWTDDQERGRGIALVDAIADAWGVEDVGLGKVIWFELERPSTARPA